MNRLAALCLAGSLVAPACAQEKKEEELPWTKLTLSPAPAPVPALKYHLLPELRDLKPGNAALLYQRAHSPEWFTPFRRSPDYQKYHEWLEAPLAKFPRDQAAGFPNRMILDELDQAARRATCDWELTERVRKEGFFMLVPDLQSFREYASLLALRARVEMFDKQTEKAVYTLQTGYALGRHVADAPTLINGLVGVAIVSVMNTQLRDLIQQPGAPNLYWALTDLPSPFIDMRKPLEGERLISESAFPGMAELVKTAKARPLSTREIRDHLESVADALKIRRGWEPGVALLAAQLYPEAKQFLIAQGRNAKEVDKMPVFQVSLLYALSEYERMLDNVRKWNNVPFPEALAGLRKSQQAVGRRRAEGFEGWVFLTDMVPSEKVLWVRYRIEREFAALRVVEAIRLHAVAHDGKLPAMLDDIRDVPIPIDPITGKAFSYKLEDGKAFLSSPPPVEVIVPIRYEITLRPLPQKKE